MHLFGRNVLSVFTLLTKIVAELPKIVADANLELQLRDHLFAQYSKSVVPVSEYHRAIVVKFDMVLLRILSMDEREEKVTEEYFWRFLRGYATFVIFICVFFIFKVQACYHLVWKNEKITWQPEKWGNITKLVVPHDKVWLPELTLLSNANKEAPKPHKGTDYIVLHSNGMNHWRPIVTLAAEFRVNIKYFPFDLQNVKFKFASWVLNVDKLRILDDNPREQTLVKRDFTSAEWRIVGAKKEVKEVLVEEEDYCTQVHFVYSFVRKPSYYVITLIVPCIILKFIILFSYFLPAKSGERMGVIVTVLLAFAVFLEIVRSSLPENADSTSVLAVFYLVSMTLSTFSFVTTCVVISLLQEKEKLPPLWIRRYIIKSVGPAIDPCNTPPTSVTSIQSYDAKWYQKFTDERDAQRELRMREATMITCAQNTCAGELKIIKSLLAEHAHTMKQELEREMAVKERRNHINKEWETLADLLDRFCFYLFTVLFHVVSFVVLIPAYCRYKDVQSMIDA